MIVIPHRLLDSPHVHVLLREEGCLVLHKRLPAPLYKRQGYVSMPVLGLLLSGEQQLEEYDGQRRVVRAGQGVLAPSSLYVISDLLPQRGPFESLLCYFDVALVHQFLAHYQGDFVPRAQEGKGQQFDLSPQVQDLARQTIALYQQQPAGVAHWARLKTEELLHCLHQSLGGDVLLQQLFALTVPKRRQLTAFMEANFDKPLKVEDYAHLTGRSLSSFRRDFKQLHGMPPQQWLRGKRLAKAEQLLLTQEWSVAALAQAIGYDNVSHFIRLFRQQYGLSPKQYALAHR